MDFLVPSLTTDNRGVKLSEILYFNGSLEFVTGKELLTSLAGFCKINVYFYEQWL